MRIAILTNAFPPDGRGGAERIASLQANGLASAGHEVRVWAPDGNEDEGGAAGEGVRRYPSRFSSLADMNAASRLIFHLNDLRARADLVQEIAAWKPDILLTHNLTGCGIGTPNAIAKSFSSNPRFKWIHVLHDVQLTEPSGQVRAGVPRAAYERLSAVLLAIWIRAWSALRKAAFGAPHVLLSPSQWLLDWHRAHGFAGKRDLVLPNPVLMEVQRERTRYRPATVVFVGRLSEDKGFSDMLKLIPKLDLAAVGSVVIIGDGPLYTGISLLNDPRVDMRGQCDPDEVRCAIAEADLLIAPSRILENQPTVILEAMAEGTPVVATNVGGVSELLEGTGAIMLNVTDDLADRMAVEIRELLRDPKRWIEISHALRQRAEERHGMSGYTERLTGLLK